MKKQNIKSKSGFTIIEVVLVLAIAGLIFLMVFIALPALQRSQRDTQRRDDMARLATALTNWQTNHNNSLPTVADRTTFLNNYLKSDKDEFQDPADGKYGLTITTLESGQSGSGADRPDITLYTNAKCSGESAVYDKGDSKYAIVYKLEGSGTFCQDSQ